MNATLLLAILVALLTRGGGADFPAMLPAAYGQFQSPIGGGAGVFIVPAQFSQNTYGCYLMDVDQQTIVSYQFMPAEKQLRLVAARHFRWDRRLHNYNTPRPSPEEVRQLIEQEQASERTADAPKPEPRSPEVTPPQE